MEIGSQSHSRLEAALYKLPDDEYLMQKREKNGAVTLFAQPELPRDAPVHVLMSESRAARQPQSAYQAVREEFIEQFGRKNGPLVFARAVESLGLDMGQPFTVGMAKKMLWKAPELADQIGGERLHARQQPVRPAMPTLHLGQAHPGEADTTDVDALIERVLSSNDLQRVPPESRAAVRAEMRGAMANFEKSTFAPPDPSDRRLALMRVAEGALIIEDIKSGLKDGLSTNEHMLLLATISRTHFRPDRPLWGASSDAIHSLFLTHSVKSTCEFLTLLDKQKNLDFSKLDHETLDALCTTFESDGPEAALFLAYGPKGMKIEAQGSISGQQQVDSVPDHAARRLREKSGQSIGAVVKEGVLTPLLAERGRWEEFARMALPPGTAGDFGRMRYHIETGPNNWFWSEDEHKVSEVVIALRAFAGAKNNNAIAILSAVMGQGWVHALQDLMTRSDGRGVANLAIDGGLHSALWTITEAPDGNYVIDFSLPVNLRVDKPLGNQGGQEAEVDLAQRIESGMKKLLGEDGQVGATFSLEIIIDAKQAAQGVVDVSVPGGMTIDFHDKLPPQ